MILKSRATRQISPSPNVYFPHKQFFINQNNFNLIQCCAKKNQLDKQWHLSISTSSIMNSCISIKRASNGQKPTTQFLSEPRAPLAMCCTEQSWNSISLGLVALVYHFPAPAPSILAPTYVVVMCTYPMPY